MTENSCIAVNALDALLGLIGVRLKRQLLAYGRQAIFSMSSAEKRKYEKQGKDYADIVGVKYNCLTVKEVLPRGRDARGRLKSPECLVECECGNIKTVRVYDVVHNNIISCGCHRGKRTVDRDENVPGTLLLELQAKYFCPYTTNVCVRSKKLHLCCRECDRYENCPVACISSPDKCEANFRDKAKDKKEFGI